jgi:hypothetical protein
MRNLARHLGRLALSIALGLGWLAFLTGCGLFIAEKSGILTVVVRDSLARSAGAFGSDLALEEARLRWFQPALELSGLEIGPQGDMLRLENVELRAEVSYERGLHLARAVIEGGHLRFARALEDVWGEFSKDSARHGGFTNRAQELPMVILRGLEVELETPGLGVVPLGRVDALLASAAGGRPVLSGRMVPSLAPISSRSEHATSGEIFFSGREARAGEFELRASASRVPLSTDSLPLGTPLDALRPHQPKALLALRAQGSFSIYGRSQPRAHVRLSITDGSAVAVGGQQKFEGLDFEAEADYAPPSPADLLAPAAWRGTVELSGQWEGTPFQSYGILGEDADEDAAVKTWIHVPRLPLTHALVELAGNASVVNEYWNEFEPRGEAEVWIGLACPALWRLEDASSPAIEVGVEAGMGGAAGITYHGRKNPATVQYDQGFPLPLRRMTGSAVYARDPRRERPFRMGLIDLAAQHDSGTLRGSGWISDHPVTAPPYMPGYGYAEIDLKLASERLDVDDHLRTALLGLSDVLRPSDSWEQFQPSGGHMSVDVHLVRSVDMSSLATRVTLGLEDVDLTWRDLPVPVNKAHGRLTWVSDGRTERGVSVALEGGLATAQSIRMGMRMQTDPALEASEKALNQIELVDVDVRRVSLTGADKKILVTENAGIGSAMDLLSPKGFADVEYMLLRTGPGADLKMTAEVVPRDTVQLTPQTFKVPTSDVRGRVFVSSSEPDRPQPGANAHATEAASRVETRLMPLVGVWQKDVQVAFTVEYPDGDVRVFGAGIDPSNKSLLGALSTAIQTPGSASKLDLSALSVEGPLDFTGGVHLSASTPEDESSSGRLYLRNSSLTTSTSSFRLDALVGVLEIKNKTLFGAHVSARLAGTPVALSDVRFSTTKDGSRLESRFSTEGFPLDAEHLRQLVDPKTLAAILGELHLRGRIDVGEGRFALVTPRQGDTRIELSGKVTPNEVFVQMGLPLSIRSASASIEQLILEGGRVRAVLRIDDLYGEIADRKLEKANLLLTYVEPRLSIESLSGQFEGGEIHPLGEGSARGGTVFSLDLEEPFPFQLALELRNVLVGGLVQGLFPSNLAAKGLLDCRLRLTGNTEDILGIQGSGSIEVRESRLWPVPVFRALLSQIGLGDEAVFDSMASNFRIKNGVILMTDNQVHSQLVQLVGETGEMDFSGRMAFDLDLHYALVDRLGPFRRLLYSIQNKLLSVQIRGDMSRPVVILKNPLSRLFSGRGAGRTELPLPGFSALPVRF